MDANTGAGAARAASASDKSRSAPADFAENAAKLSQRDLRARYRIGLKLLARWFAETGAAPRPFVRRRPLPDDFAARAGASSNKELMAHYRAALGVIVRWRKEAGAVATRVTRFGMVRMMPADFSRVAPTMTRHQLRQRYDIGECILSRWCLEAGVKPKRQSTFVSVGPRAAASAPPRDTSLIGRAADHLRRLGPVYRACAAGRPNPKGTHWRRGSAILTDEELVGRAKRNGFEPDGWLALRTPTPIITEGART